MKKLLGIVVLGLLWFTDAFALTQQQFIDQNLKGRKLDQIEGVWLTASGRAYGIYKSGGGYNTVIISSKYFRSGETIGHLTKGSENIFYGTEVFSVGESSFDNVSVTYSVNFNTVNINISGKYGKANFVNHRLWPSNIASHNDKFEESSGKKKLRMTTMIKKAQNTCKELGFKEDTEKFADCSLKLYSQSIELAAQNNQQIVIQNQGSSSSSGSNNMTIFDPVRDSNALIQKGQKMLSGACTLGIDC